MSKKPRHKQKLGAFGNREPTSFVMLDHGLLKSLAWKHLSPHSTKLYIAVRARHNGMNNGFISYSTREAMSLLGSGPNRAVDCFGELQDKGLLICTHESSFSLKTKEARLWAITAEKIGDNPATRDFKKWTPEIHSTVTERVTHGIRESNREHENGSEKAPTVIERVTVMPSRRNSRLPVE